FVFSTLDLLQPQVHCIIKRGSSSWLAEGNIAPDARALVGEALDQRGLLVEGHEEELVVRISCFQKTDYRVARCMNVILHAPADVEKNSHTDGCGLLSKV